MLLLWSSWLPNFSYLIKPANWDVRAIQDNQNTLAAQPIPDAPQDLEKK